MDGFDEKTSFDSAGAEQNPPEVFNGQDNGMTPNLKYGLGDTAKSGCGWIAAFNAALLSGRYVSPSEVIMSIISYHGLRLWGLLGTRSKAIARFLRALGLGVSRRMFPGISFKKITYDDRVKNSGILILEYLWFFGGHYVTVKYDPGGDGGDFLIYSDRKYAVMPERRSSVDGWLKKKEKFLFILSAISILR